MAPLPVNPLNIFNPEKQSSQKTNYPGSMFHIAIKESYHIYLEVFEDNEVCATVFKDQKHQLSYAGSLEECIEKISNTINNELL